MHLQFHFHFARDRRHIFANISDIETYFFFHFSSFHEFRADAISGHLERLLSLLSFSSFFHFR